MTIKGLSGIYDGLAMLFEAVQDDKVAEYLNEKCSEKVADLYPFEKSLDEQIWAIMNWIVAIEEDLESR